VKLVKFSKIELMFLVGVFVASFCVLVFFRLNLSETSAQAIQQFSQQNRFELATGDTMQLATKLNALMASESIQCVDGTYSDQVFIAAKKGSCFTSATNQRQKVDISTAKNLDIFITYKMPRFLTYSALALIATQILVIFAFFKVYSDKMNLALAGKEQLIAMANQVAHDIRSPLSALNMVSSFLHEVPQEKRQIVQSAIQRINDIANDLLVKSPTALLEQTQIAINTIPAAQIVEAILAEKRIQFQNYPQIKIVSDLSADQAQITADAKNLQRVISNLINNSVEAFENQRGEITVSLRAYKNQIQLSIKDNGRGIPDNILEKLGEQGITHGKANGSGLGLYHAKKTLTEMGGQLNITSKVGAGTLANIVLPRA